MAKDKASSSKRRRRTFPWLGVFGATLIFLSWVFQNKTVADATGKRLYLERSQLAIDLQQMRMEHWNAIYLQEKSKPQPSDKIVRVAALKTLQSYGNIVAWSSARLQTNPLKAESDIAEKNAVQRAMETSTTAEIEADLTKSFQLENELHIAGEFASRFNAAYTDVTSTENMFTLLFLATYILGSILVGFEFMFKIQHDQ